jgi:HAD superfamily hydrolase (TIGR01484 family)
MKRLAELDAAPIRFVLTDLDDTLTSAGKLTAEAYGALQALQRAGKQVILVTGRPAGWCDHIARMWPVDAVVGENGAFYFWFAGGRLGKRFVDDAATRARHRRALARIAHRILAQVPGAALAADQGYRETDLAIDYCEDVPALPLASAERIAELMRAAGLSAKVSSIHVNGWFGRYDKLSAVRLVFAERFGAPSGVRRRFAERRAAFQLLPELRRRGKCATLSKARAPVHRRGRGRRWIRRARRASAAGMIIPAHEIRHVA